MIKRMMVAMFLVVLFPVAGCGDIQGLIDDWNADERNDGAVAKRYDLDDPLDGIADVVAADMDGDGEISEDEIIEDITAKIEQAKQTADKPAAS